MTDSKAAKLSATKLIDIMEAEFPFYLQYCVHVTNKVLLNNMVLEIVERVKNSKMDNYRAGTLIHDIKNRLDKLNKEAKERK